MRARTVVVAVVVALAVVPPPAQAQAPQASSEVRALRKEVTTLFRSKRYEEALQALEKLRAVDDNPLALFNTARCYEELGRLDAALSAFEEHVRFETDPKVAVVSRGKSDALRARLFGTVEVACGAVEEATASLDGGIAVPCPARWPGVHVGTHRVRVTAAGYATWEQAVTVEGSKTARVVATLERAPAALRVSSEPGGAAVLVDGSPAGVTPVAALVLPPGIHRVELRLAGHRPWSGDARLVAGAVAEVSQRMVPEPGVISVASTPAGADVIVDGVLAGKTPVDVRDVAAGPHGVTLRLPGYRQQTVAVDVAPGKVATVSARLEPVAVERRPMAAPQVPASATEASPGHAWVGWTLGMGAGVAALAAAGLVAWTHSLAEDADTSHAGYLDAVRSAAQAGRSSDAAVESTRSAWQDDRGAAEMARTGAWVAGGLSAALAAGLAWHLWGGGGDVAAEGGSAGDIGASLFLRPGGGTWSLGWRLSW